MKQKEVYIVTKEVSHSINYNIGGKKGSEAMQSQDDAKHCSVIDGWHRRLSGGFFAYGGRATGGGGGG